MAINNEQHDLFMSVYHLIERMSVARREDIEFVGRCCKTLGNDRLIQSHRRQMLWKILSGAIRAMVRLSNGQYRYQTARPSATQKGKESATAHISP